MAKYYFFGNYVLTAAFVAWFTAQFIKVILNLFKSKTLIWERLWGSGGMPSAHSASVTALTVAIGRTEGPSSALFALAFLNALIVMYDAMGVRRAAGEQAKVLNEVLRESGEETNDEIFAEKKSIRSIKGNHFDLQKIYLKEVLGHTPIEVVCGIALGCFIAFFMPISA